MSDWTLGAVKARNMELGAYCTAEACRNFYTFDLDQLIAGVGAEYRVADIPPMECRACGGPLEIKLAMVGPENGEESGA